MTTDKQHNVVIDIKSMLDGAVSAEPPVPQVSGDCCIYRVPYDIRKLNEDAYTPRVVAIGPFHRGRPKLQNMERHKLIYCKAFLERAETTLDTLVHYIKEVELKFRHCYSHAIKLNKDELVKVILVDSCFILELFWRYFYDEWSNDDKLLLKLSWLANTVKLDLMLLENQLPFFVLDNIFNLSFSSRLHSGTVNGENKFPSFIELSFEYFCCYNRSKLPFHNISIRHFIDLIRTFHLQERKAPRIIESVIHLPSATKLLETGVKFKVNTNSDCLLDFKFSKGVLEIPLLKVEDWTENLLRNMVALEHCHYPYESYITDFVVIWDFLINTNKDVDLMVQKRVLVHLFGDSNSITNLFNSLRINISHLSFSEDYFRLFKDLDAYCANPWPKRKVTLRRDYCNTPWQTAATIAGIVILVLTLVQSVCSVLQVLQQ